MKEGEGRRKKEEGRRKKEGGRRKEEGGRRKEEGGRRREEGGRKGREGLVWIESFSEVFVLTGVCLIPPFSSNKYLPRPSPHLQPRQSLLLFPLS